MPEGDTLFKIARTLHAVLAGKGLTRVRARDPRIAEAALAGRTVTLVEQRGKWLLVHLDDGRVLATHLRLTGSWHLYREGEKWQRAEKLLRLALDVPGFSAVCFNAPVVELLTPAQLRAHPVLATLGPDAISDDFDAAEALRRLRALGETAVGEALLAQGALSGLGNVYKAEALFLAGQDPFAKVSQLSDEQLAKLVEVGHKLMRENRFSGPRVTMPTLGGGSARWVYGRAGQPCRTCQETIRMRRQGSLGRSTYYCPRCQSVSELAGAPVWAGGPASGQGRPLAPRMRRRAARYEP